METETKRSSKMNKCLHKLLGDVANEMLAQGIERKTVMNDLEGYSCPVDASFLKEVWRSIQFTQTGKLSTTQVTNAELSRVYDTFNVFLGESYGIHLPWPSYDEVAMAEFYSNN